MILSMTGFGKAEIATKNKKILIEIKSVNGKAFDLSCRIPSAYRAKEMEIRSLLFQRIERGKVDLFIGSETLASGEMNSIDFTQLLSYYHQIQTLCKEQNLPLPQDITSLLLKLPSVIGVETEEISEEEWKAVWKGLEEAIEHFIAFRQQEGSSLEKVFVLKTQRIRALLEEVAPFEQERVGLIRARLEDRLKELQNVEYDKNRLEQEMIYYIEKLDVNEEKQRLGNHIKYFLETLQNGKGQGKKLGFILQEMGREINTLGSKSNHSEMQRIVVEMKDNLEQMKEQVLNVL